LSIPENFRSEYKLGVVNFGLPSLLRMAEQCREVSALLCLKRQINTTDLQTMSRSMFQLFLLDGRIICLGIFHPGADYSNFFEI
jgi:hypothetical protein